MPMIHDKLRVITCRAWQDQPLVRELHQRLLAEGAVDPWLDEAGPFFMIDDNT